MNPNHLSRLFPNASKAFIRANADGVQPPKPEQNDLQPLESVPSRKEEGQGRVTLSITIFCVRPQDADNRAGGCKPLVDQLRYAGLISDDCPEDIKLEVDQVKVSHYAEEKTVISITKP